MASDLELLDSALAPGSRVANDWDVAERSLEVTFPSGFMKFLEVFGDGTVDEFLHIFRAGAASSYMDLTTMTRTGRQTMADTRPPIQELLATYDSSPGRLIQWGSTIDSDMLFLIPADLPADWAVLCVEGRGIDFDFFQGSVESYLLQIIQRDLTSAVFPEDFPSSMPSFARHSGAVVA